MICTALGGVALALAACESMRSGGGLPVGAEVDFERHVKPVLEFRCLQCHNREAMPGRLSLETRELAMTEGAHGRAIVPGDPDNSRLLNYINAPRDSAVAMPHVGHSVPDDDVETLREWIAAGAEWPDGEAGQLRPR